MREGNVVILPDVQHPYVHRPFLKRMIRFIGDYQPAALYSVGDWVDMPQPSRWTKGTAGEYEETLQHDVDDAVSTIRAIRDVYSGYFGIRMGNHDERLEAYVAQYAPALRSLRALKFEELMQAERYALAILRRITKIAPETLLMHGHEPAGSASGLNRTNPVLAAVKRYGCNVIMGHWHASGLISHAVGRGTDRKYRFGLLVGHAMDETAAVYLKDQYADWRMSFGIIYVRAGKTYPHLVFADESGRFVVDGRRYE
jgi:hypothetical protein